MKLLITVFEILGWLACGFIILVLYPILMKLISIGQSLHHLWS